MNGDAENPIGVDLLVVAPDTTEEEKRSKDFADLMAKARALKPGDDAATQDLLYKSAHMTARDKITPLQAQMLVDAIHTSTGFKLEGLKKTWKKYYKTAEKEAREEAAAAAASAGPRGAGGAGSAGWGPAGASSNASYAGASSQYCMDESGLYWRRDKKWERIAAPFEILGLARDTEKDDWGKLLRFKNEDENVCEEIITEEMLRRDPNGVIGLLVRRGMWVSGVSAEQRAALEYLMLEFHIVERVTRARSTGWIKVGAERVFVLPTETIGASSAERVVLNQHSGAAYAQRGTLDEWREAIAKPAGDHLMMRISISTSLAGTLLDLGGFESGILNFWGDSAQGKTTLLRIAASSWGSGADGGYMRVWRTTANAMEASLSLANDTLFVVDELGQADDRELGAMVYMVAGSQGKTRMRADASLKTSYKWRVLVLSSGERPIAARIGEGQKVKRPHAGQLVRAVDIPEGRALGMFDRVSPDFDARAFAIELKRVASKYYGTAGPQFVRELIERSVTGERVRKLVTEFVSVALKGITKDHGQAARVAERFGLIAVAGKLATEFGVVTWPEGQVAKDALELFKDWLAARGGAAPVEIAQMIAQVRRFIEAHGDSRFDNLDPPPNNPLTGQEIERRSVNNRAGWRKGEGEDRRWYVLPETWREEVCAGFDPSKVAKTLAAHDMLEPGAGGKMSRPEAIEGKKMRAYVLKRSIFEGWGEA
jgi:putative DNA primase/helicase